MDQIASSTAPSNSAKSRVPVYEVIVRDLIDFGVTDCFGLTSDDTLGLTAALDANGVRVWSARHESSVVMAADGYSSASGNVGLAIIGRGPAAANCMHGIMAAAGRCRECEDAPRRIAPRFHTRQRSGRSWLRFVP